MQTIEAQNKLRPEVDWGIPAFQRVFQSSHARRATIIVTTFTATEMQTSSDTYACSLA